MFPTFYIPRNEEFLADVAIDANSSSMNGLSGEWVEFTMTRDFTLIVTAGYEPWSFTPSDDYNPSEFPEPWVYRFGLRNMGTGVVTDYWHPGSVYYAPNFDTYALGLAFAGTRVEIPLVAGTYRFFLWDATVNDNRGTGRYRLSTR